MEPLPYKLAGVRVMRTPVCSSCWIWNKVSVLWVEAGWKKRAQFLGHIHEECNLFNSELERKRKAGDLHLLLRYISLDWGLRVEGASSSWSQLPREGLPSTELEGGEREGSSCFSCHEFLLLLLNSEKKFWIRVSSFAVCLRTISRDF